MEGQTIGNVAVSQDDLAHRRRQDAFYMASGARREEDTVEDVIMAAKTIEAYLRGEDSPE